MYLSIKMEWLLNDTKEPNQLHSEVKCSTEMFSVSLFFYYFYLHYSCIVEDACELLIDLLYKYCNWNAQLFSNKVSTIT